MSENKIAVLVVDDSALMRNIISRLIEKDSALEVVGTAMNGQFGLTKIPRLNPDVIVLDLEMPEMNGIDFLKEMHSRGHKIPVVILSSIAKKGARVTMEALALGASDFITKPSGSASDELEKVGDHLVTVLKAYGSDYRRKHGNSIPPLAVEQAIPQQTFTRTSERSGFKQDDWDRSSPEREPERPEIIAIGISTGGPNALRKVFAELDPNLSVPIVVVQHMPAGFTREFAASLDRICPLEVKEAAEGDIVRAGRILIAPGDAHISIEKKSLASMIHLHDSELINGHKPSAGVLFNSIAKEFRNKSIAVIMTGMGKDGAREIGNIFREGGMTIAQDSKSCIVYGMPRVAVEHNYIRKIVSLDDMAQTICTLAEG
ncbi:chemotaxis response regulator protein-glutamate methylesterase [Oceanispirochaeta crateris]|uniref:Protein-glutamate methylesterase/protein-glutamine glutaminase n=1 Tax=Oceanispirochaeta crateris TaxID=2518645 RepID=A0A5C1QNE3_9SPIO|nr:chemotaxis response regulator protein-glutamate methylesterase [Oceanispirochaeta crateris]QEN09191.1 chemotaxis response regulator protein-glutamate methylesterase [Oceanispirochaeta crateris]